MNNPSGNFPSKSSVLVVEDDPIVLRLMTTMLCGRHTVYSAADGSAAMQLFPNIQEGIKLLITDIRMPGFTGTELARELKAQQRDLPVLFVSGYSDVDLEKLTPEDRFLPKPFTSASLRSGVGALLGHRLPLCSACGKRGSERIRIEDDGLSVIATSICSRCSAETKSVIMRAPNTFISRCPIDDGPMIPRGYGFVGPNQHVWNVFCLTCQASMQSRSPNLKAIPW